MAYREYVSKKFSAASLRIIEQADAIMVEYKQQGFALTLRQLYYQFVARGIIPNKQTEYKRLGSLVNDGRLAGLLDWDGIEDRTRNIVTPATWDSPGDIIQAAASSYQIDLWQEQPWRPEVWIEKDALTGVIEPVCDEKRVAYFACRGYASQSEVWRAAMRIVNRFKRDKQKTVIFHLGDHDPSGIDMTRDNEDRLEMFCRDHGAFGAFRIERLALNMDQVERFSPPPNPCKLTDSRADGYLAAYGDESWELDALDPTTIDEIIRSKIDGVLEDGDPDHWSEMERREQSEKEGLELLASRHEDAVEYLRNSEEGED